MYRVETGNYEYRLVLRCRQDARIRFAQLRSDVLVKLELLDQKHVQDVVTQLQRLITAFANFHTECYALLKDTTVFPLEVDLSSNCSFTYPDLQATPYQDEDEEEETAEEALAEIPEKYHQEQATSLSLLDSNTAECDLLGLN